MQIQAPDIGVDKALVAEILVKVGDHVAVEDSLLVLESDKATVEVPSTAAGVVKSILVKQGDEVTEGVALIELEEQAQASEATTTEAPKAESQKAEVKAEKTEDQPAPVAAKTANATQVVDVKVPDIGVEKALVAEILVKVGDQIETEQSIVVVESDKATVEVPSSVAGVVESIQIKEGDSVKEGVVLIQVKTTTTETASAPQAEPAEAEAPASTSTTTGEVEITVPDLGVDKAVVSEILVNVGDRVEAQQSLCVVESDKASVEVPSSSAGIVKAIHVSLNQDVRQGMPLASIEVSGEAVPATAKAPKASPAEEVRSPATKPQPVAAQTQSAPAQPEKLSKQQEADNAKVYAGPAVRKLARELGVVLGQVKASGEHGRVMKDDVFAYVKTRLTTAPASPTTQAAPAASGLPALPDFSAFGGGEVKAMTRLQQVSVPQLSLNNFIPQVTQFDLADITELEAWRGELKEGFKKQGISLTILAFIAKAVAHLLKEEPYFAGHLADDQKSVLLRNEIHMGIAVATPDGLTVPVLRNPDQKSIKQIATELAELSQKARDRKLSPKDLQGANFTITSLGSIGGTAFTPLVNWPQVAILGISPATMQPVWNGKDFDPRLMLPLSLSYDHRVINGADAARFSNKLTKLLKDIRSLLL
ncbi:biotin/lipoyl-binding protein [Acinetobacter halotolerans]|uniref:Dihydrolipoamide acetyltransferase component of pyruvate dehydrogenase complex n=1 Tax=Acinetobacter halotolerans TaxID=1752076 RepID=A0A4Q6XJL3_9GAMM|nr:2-oxo acid dehydrogenase subunit E2 [Acinetobacter halotolerans]RZF56800.1 biotin/lipoyl-binding protein [Acinetobacter halotolerans]